MGRRAELDLFRTALSEDLPPFAVLHVHGPGGVGKSAMLARLSDEACQAGRRTVLLDGRGVTPSPAGLTAAISAALGVADGEGLAALRGQDAPVLLLDTYELLGPLDDWIRDSLLPQLPERSIVVLAGRRPPAPGWRADPAWDQLLRVVALRDLQSEDARALLSLRGVDVARQDEALRISRGHPLALVLVADVLQQQQDDERFALEEAPEVIETLLDRFLREVPSDRHRRALYAAAHVGVATEGLLRDAVDSGAAAELFDWLRSLSFTEPLPRGVAVHGLVGDVLNADLRSRDPDAWVSLHESAAKHLRHRTQHTSGPDQDLAMLDFLQLYRLNPLTRRFFDWDRTHTLWLEPAVPADHHAIRELARQHEGDRSAELASYWLDRQPQAFTVFRKAGTAAPDGFVTHLLLDDTPAVETEVDPVAAAAWEHVRARAPLRAGERLRILRFWIARDTYQDVATHHLVSARSSLDWFTTEHLAWAFVALADPDLYEPIFRFIDFERLPDPGATVGDRRYGMFARDMRASSQREWADLLDRRRVSSAPDLDRTPAVQHRLLVLARADFVGAVRDALRGVARPGGLDGNPLLRSRVVVERAGGRTGDQTLRDLLAQTAAELGTHPRDERRRRALELTYLRPAPTQEAAAERLGLPFSTFRRHLSSGVDHVASRLWELEVYGDERPQPGGDG